NNPLGNLSTDALVVLAGQSPTKPRDGWGLLPSFTLQVRDRLTPTGEIAFFGMIGQSSSGTGGLGVTWHGGPEAPNDPNRYVFGLGYYLTLAQYWGMQPDSLAPGTPGLSFNPNFSGMLSLGWARKNRAEFDLILGGTVSRWGQVNGVPVEGFISPYL